MAAERMNGERGDKGHSLYRLPALITLARLEEIVGSIVDERLGSNASARLTGDLATLNEWQGKYAAAQQEVQTQKAEYARLQAAKDDLQSKYDATTRELQEKTDELARLQATNNDWQGKYAIKQKEVQTKEAECARLRADNGILQQNIAIAEGDLQHMGDELAFYKHHFGHIVEAQARCLQLPVALQKELQGFFGDLQNLAGFLCGAVNADHLPAFWDYIATYLNEGKLQGDELAIMQYLFDFCFAAANAAERESRFIRLASRPGAPFDRNGMRLVSGSQQLGTVQKELFAGFKSGVSGNIVRPSLVLLG